MKQTEKPEKSWGLYKLKPLFQVLGFWVLLVGSIVVFALIILSADKLGYFFIPAVLLYFAALAGTGYFLLRRHEKLEEHGLMGDELYYTNYPVDRWFHERKLALAAWLRKKRDK